MTKVLAFYLPQYHSFQENDEWWGEGFTEWTNVKSGKPLFRNHYQPHKPYQNDYYDLADIEVMRRQAEMALKYGVDGFCFYHYWFDGKLLMQKPLENLLADKSIDIPFCFSWANEPWTRTWDGDKGAKQILISQTYGNESVWKEHFAYLLPFFKDERYIKVNNKPMFLIYRATLIPRCDEMIDCWNGWARDNGFDGIHFVSTMSGVEWQYKVRGFNAIVDFEPNITCKRMMKVFPEAPILRKIPIIRKKVLPIFDYAEICKNIVDRRLVQKNAYYGMFVGFDNTARRGRGATRIVVNNTPSEFEKYFGMQYRKSVREEREFLFINAWNEWGEGCHLEPDEKYGFAYLEAVKKEKV